MIDLILAFIWSFFVSVFSIPSIIFVAHVKNLLDEPNSRNVHDQLTPRLGGLAIFAGFMSSITIFGQISFGIQQLLAGCMILFFLGVKDDIVSVSAFKKFFVQILATGIILFIGDIRITSFQGFLGLYELEAGFSYAFSFFVIIGLTNSINLLDGIDGLAGSVVIFICGLFGFLFFISGTSVGLAYSMVAIGLLGSMLGFLRYNFKNAIIFMGDTGSLVSGFIISVLAIKFVEISPVDNAPAVAIAILIVPLIDTLRVFIIRILKGSSPFSPDKNHIHHVLSKFGLSNIQTIIGLLTANAVLFITALLLSEWSNSAIIGIIGSSIGILILALEVAQYRFDKAHEA